MLSNTEEEDLFLEVTEDLQKKTPNFKWSRDKKIKVFNINIYFLGLLPEKIIICKYPLIF